MRRRSFTALVVFSASTVLGGCRAFEPEPQSDGFVVWEMTPSTATTTPGGVVPFTVTVSGKADATALVDFVEDVTPGFAVVMPERFTGQQTQGTGTITVSPTLEPGTYQFKVRARQVGDAEWSGRQSIAIIVGAAPAAPDFSLGVDPVTFTMPFAPAAQSFTFTVTPLNGFAGNVTVTMQQALADDLVFGGGLPAAFSFPVGTTTAKGGSFTLTYQPLPPITSPVDVVLSAYDGVTTHTRTITLTLPDPLVATGLVRNPATFPEPQAGTAGQPVTLVPSVKVLDQLGAPIVATVVFSVTGGGGSLSAASVLSTLAVTSGADGIATLPAWILGAAGVNTVQATVGSLSPVVFTVNATAPVPGFTLSISAGDGQTARVTQPVLIPPAVIVRNGQGAPVSGIQITWAIVQGAGSFLPDPDSSPNTGNTGADGIAKLLYFATTTVGTAKLRATVTSTLLVTPQFVEFTITGIP